MTNLYEFLRKMLDSSYVSLEDREWLEQFLKVPENQLDFKSRRVGGTDDNPVMAQDYAIAGTQLDIFSLLTEAMMQNPTFADLVMGAAKFFQDHVPNCQHCKAAVLQATTKASWEFKPHPSPKEEREFPCPDCETGELLPMGFTKPNGQTDYQCNNCGHNESYP
jgi:DNA-directed RNA polymerase subunit RPC12/RpoP